MTRKSDSEILVGRGLINEDGRARAELAAEQGHCSFFEAVVRLGLATEEAVAQARAEELGLTFASLANKLLVAETGQDLEKLVPEAFAREHMVLPIFKDADKRRLTVAMAEPDNPPLLENLRMIARLEIQPLMAPKSHLFKAIDALYMRRGTDLIAKTLASGGPTEAVDASVTSSIRIDLDKGAIGGVENQSVNVVNAILKQAVAERGSDIHLEIFEEQVMLRFRIDGMLFERTPPPAALFPPVVSRIKILARLDIAERRLPQDGMFSVYLHGRQIDVRVSVCPADSGEKVVMRLLDKEAVSLDMNRLGLEPKQQEDFLAAARAPHGLIFLTGPTGSGKTTTLYTVLSAVKTPALNFMTIEDPIEIKLKGMTQVQVKSQIGLTFASALRSFLRQDPDVILVGEVRDGETAQTCLRAALTGHLVFSTLHTNDAMSAAVRLLDLGAEPFLLSSSLTLLAAQRLVRILCPQCKKPAAPSARITEQCLAETGLTGRMDPAKIVFYDKVGCPACFSTGYQGRVGVYEVYPFNEELREIIYKTRGNVQDMKAAAVRAGLWNMRASAWLKAINGITSVEEVLTSTVLH
jgi:type IV pilus assembly protein PilB